MFRQKPRYIDTETLIAIDKLKHISQPNLNEQILEEPKILSQETQLENTNIIIEKYITEPKNVKETTLPIKVFNESSIKGRDITWLGQN